MDLYDLSKDTLIKIIDDYKLKLDSLQAIIDSSKVEPDKNPIKPVIKPTITLPNCWRLQVWGGCKNGKSQSYNKSMIMELFYEKGVHLIDIESKDIDNQSYINIRRKQQMERISIGDKVYMCDNKSVYYEGVLKENYKPYPGESMIKTYPNIVETVWGNPFISSNHCIYITHIDWVKKTLTDEMESYLVKSTKNGGGRIQMQGTILKLKNLI